MANVKISNFPVVSGVIPDVNNMTAIAGVEFDSATQANINVKISGAQLITSLEANMVLDNISGTLSITKGGTGSNNAQGAIDNLTNVSSAQTNQVLTKDSSGNATFQDLPPGPTTMTDLVEGLAKVRYSALGSGEPLTPYTDAGRTYGIQLNSSNQLVVNVPWEDTQGAVTDVTAGTPSASTGLPLEVTPTTGNVQIIAKAFAGSANVGYVPANNSNPSSEFLRGDGAWAKPNNSTYTLTTVAGSQATITLTETPGGATFPITFFGGGSTTVTAPTNTSVLINSTIPPVANDNITVLLDQGTNLANTQNDTTFVVPFNGSNSILNTNANIFSATLNTSSNPNQWNAYVQASKEGNDGVFLVHGGYHSFDGQNTNAQMDLWVEWTVGNAPLPLGITSWPTGNRNLINIGSGFVSTTANGNAGQVGSCIIDTHENTGPIYFRILFRHSSFTGGSGYPVNGAINIGGATLEGYTPFISVTLIK